MISLISEAAVALSRSIELSVLGKATILLFIGLIVVRFAVRARASVRHLLLTATFSMVLALPLVISTAPEFPIGVAVTQTIEPAQSLKAPAAASEFTEPRAIGTTLTLDQQIPRARVSLTALARTIWIAGIIVLLFGLGVDLWRLHRIRRDGIPWTEHRELLQSLAAETGIRRPVSVLLHQAILAPLTYGLWQPSILLPYEACSWSEADLRRAIVHELEHVRRGDWAIQLAARLTCILYWFHPLVWIGLRWLGLEAERACDDAVVRSSERTEYAEQLVMLARRISNFHARPALGMANRSDLSTRVTALLDAGQRRGRAGWLAVAGALSAACLMLLAIAPVRAVTRSTRQNSQSAASPSAMIQKRIASALDRALLEAAADGATGDIDELIRAGANVNSEIKGDGTPLIAAARAGYVDAVHLLLDRGADPNASVHGDGNALIAAAGAGFADVVALLLDRGANIDDIVPGDENALIQASASGHLDVVKLLVSRGANVNVRAWAANEIPDGAWEVKVRQNNADSEGKKVFLLRDVQVSTDGKEKGEWRTPLSVARRENRTDVVKFLLESGAKE